MANHDSGHLKEFVLHVMTKYGLPLSHVLACVVDNASNMTKTIKLLNEKKQEEEEEEDQDEEEEEDEAEEAAATAEGEQSDEGENANERENPEIDMEQFPNIGSLIDHIKCASHTLQLGIEDGLKVGRPAVFITKLQHIAQKLRAPKLDLILKRRCGKGALMMNQTRWGSKLAMCQRILELKDVIQDLAADDVKLTDREWEELERLVETLKVPDKATVSLQKESLTPGECLPQWREVVFRLQKLRYGIAMKISQCIESREKKLFESNIFTAAG